MTRHQLFAVVLGLSTVNGMFSPYLGFVLQLSPLWMPNWMPGSPGVLFYVSSMLTATTTLLVSGIPAAVAERFVPGLREGTGSMAIWAVSAFALTLPGLVRLFYLFAG
jgi:heme/copper-type cytochrome/quinol oxidase subunit 3